MTGTRLVAAVSKVVRLRLSGEGTGHDWYHVERVWKVSKYIAAREKNVDSLVVELGALLHDIADAKFTGDEHSGERESRAVLESLNAPTELTEQVVDLVATVSFAGGKKVTRSRECQVVYDADKLDALGAIGIARTFAYGGAKSRAIYDPKQKPHTGFKNAAAYRNANGTSVNHFYEKLLKLKGLMYTKTGKKLAAQRHRFLESFLKQFYAEWNTKLP